MHTDQHSVSDHLRITIERELRPGETLVWVGQPDPALFSREVARACLFQFVLIVLFVPVSVFVISRISGPGTVVICVILLACGIIVYFLIAAPWRYPQRIQQTIYAITDQRALVHQGIGWSLLWLEALPNLYSTLWTFDARQIRARRRIQRYDGRTDLVFSGESHAHMTGKGQIRDWVQVGFLGLKNVVEVDGLLEDHFANADTERR
jgi:hypothetical protein